MKAEGKAEAAQAKSLAEKIADAMKQQDTADAAAEAVAKGKANNPLEAATTQQEVAEQAAALKKSQVRLPKSPRLFSKLRKSAATAAKETLGGNPAKRKLLGRKLVKLSRKPCKPPTKPRKKLPKRLPASPMLRLKPPPVKKPPKCKHLAADAQAAAGDDAKQAEAALGEATQQAAARRKLWMPAIRKRPSPPKRRPVKLSPRPAKNSNRR